MEGSLGLYRPTITDLPQLLQTLINAYIDYPLYVWTIPDREERQRTFKHFFSMNLRYSFKFGAVYATSDTCDNVAIFVHPGSGKMTNWRWMRCGGLGFMHNCAPASFKRCTSANVFVEKIREKDAPPVHSYLYMLAVDPLVQGNGLGMLLVKSIQQQLEGNGVPCYVDTFKGENEAFYHHLGFETIEKYPLPKSDLTLISLLWAPSSWRR
jgi:ribosomal protein S18 acetylase RimI-like enzyme